MPTPWTPSSSPSPSVFVPRDAIWTAWGISRLWGAYLKTVAWAYVTDSLGRRIVVIVAWGSLTISVTPWTPRTPI